MILSVMGLAKRLAGALQASSSSLSQVPGKMDATLWTNGPLLAKRWFTWAQLASKQPENHVHPTAGFVPSVASPTRADSTTTTVVGVVVFQCWPSVTTQASCKHRFNLHQHWHDIETMLRVIPCSAPLLMPWLCRNLRQIQSATADSSSKAFVREDKKPHHLFGFCVVQSWAVRFLVVISPLPSDPFGTYVGTWGCRLSI